ncbi:DUF3053 domain-containing protein [Sodalis sp. dw_96]|uniref:DUF3053 domain-containing protein n=1 Tax=Sodalis sp. dw_96 TaxID=2719794 RepID=UPI001BD5B733|nr:DUF3053 domain-containing protein [Sodalis sp. dw_96]
MWFRNSLAYCRYVFVIPALILLAVQITACGDKEPDQRKAFIQFLQTTVLPGGERLPTLSDDQKKQFGPYTNDYQVLLTFTQQYTQSVNTSLLPVLDLISQIRVPQDYLTRRQDVQQSSAALNSLAPQIAQLNKQADDARAGLKQPADLKAIYNQAYTKLVTQPVQKVAPVIAAASTLSSTLVQVGDFLNTQGNQVTYGPNSVSFPNRLQATQYNELMKGLVSQYQQLVQAQTAGGATLP